MNVNNKRARGGIIYLNVADVNEKCVEFLRKLRVLCEAPGHITVNRRLFNITLDELTMNTTMDEHTVNQAITPLRLIFWGALLCVFDFNLSETTNGQGFTFDVLSDVVGTIMIAVGVFRLSALPVHDRYASATQRDPYASAGQRSRYAGAMKFVLVVSILAVVDALQAHFTPPLLPLVLLNLWGLLNLAAIVTFCIAMRWFCEAAHLDRASRSWSTTTKLFVCIYLIPLGLVYIVGILALAARAHFDIDLGPAALIVLPIFAIPLIHLFMSTSRMKRAAEHWAPVVTSRAETTD